MPIASSPMLHSPFSSHCFDQSSQLLYLIPPIGEFFYYNILEILIHDHLFNLLFFPYYLRLTIQLSNRLQRNRLYIRCLWSYHVNITWFWSQICEVFSMSNPSGGLTGGIGDHNYQKTSVKVVLVFSWHQYQFFFWISKISQCIFSPPGCPFKQILLVSKLLKYALITQSNR